MEPYVAMLRTDMDDRDITEWAMTETGNEIQLKFLEDKNELDAAIVSSGEPVLILLNDRGALQNGHERISQFKNDLAYGHIPLILLGEISTAEYIRECYRAGANSYITKPSTVFETKKKVSDFFNYWFNVAELGRRLPVNESRTKDQS